MRVAPLSSPLFFYLGTRPATVGRTEANRDSCYNPPSCNGLPGSPHATRGARAVRGALLSLRVGGDPAHLDSQNRRHSILS